MILKVYKDGQVETIIIYPNEVIDRLVHLLESDLVKSVEVVK